jgi:ParB family chromosome partitioning protein
LALSDEQQLVCAKRVISESLSVRECEAMVAGISGNKKKPATKTKTPDPNTVALERELSEIFGSSVEIKHNKKGRGKLIVNFKNLDTLQGILDKIKS